MKMTKVIMAVLMLLILQPSYIFAQNSNSAKAATKPLTECVSGNCVDGFGKKIYESGSTYEGDFVNGNKEGKGTFTSKYGMVYTGKFAKDLPNGKGKAKYENGFPK